MQWEKRYHYTKTYYDTSKSALETALERVPLYKSWRSRDPGPDVPVDKRYAALPELTKKAMRRHFPNGVVPRDMDVACGLAREEIDYTFTSGTSGEKVVNIWNQSWWNHSEAAAWKLNAHTAVLSYPQRQAKLASSLNVGIHCEDDLPMSHRILGDTLYLNEKISLISWHERHFRRMAHELNTYRPVILEANPSLLARLAFWALDEGIALYAPAAIVFTFEFPSRIHLNAMRKIFTSPFISSYGSTETGFVLEQCEAGHFHQNTEFCRIDFIPLKEQYGGPELGRILVTTFNNPWSRILRFDPGDLIRLHKSGACACGRSDGLIAEAIEGRLANATFATNGDLVTTMALDNALANIPKIRDYHLRQRSRTSYELQLLLPDTDLAVLDHARAVMQSLYGQNGEYNIKAVGDILPGPSGKFRRTQADFAVDWKGRFA